MQKLRRPMAILWCVVLLMSAVPVSGLTQDTSGSLSVERPWARATPPGTSVGGAYFVIMNPGSEDRLLRIDSPVATTAAIHQMSMKGGLMQMRPLESVLVPAHGQLQFTPESLHVMLMGLKQPLVEGRHFPMTLVFQNAGAIHIDVVVKGLGAEEGS